MIIIRDAGKFCHQKFKMISNLCNGWKMLHLLYEIDVILCVNLIPFKYKRILNINILIEKWQYMISNIWELNDK